MTARPEFSGLKGRFFAWFLSGPGRRVLEWKMGKPEPRILELLQLEGGERVLDAGCGSGFHSLLVAERVPRGSVVAVDVSTEMLDRLRKRAAVQGLAERVEILQADGLNLPTPDGSVDRALSAAVWHHLEDPQRACAELARVLRSGGRAVVCDLEIKGAHEGPVDKGHGHKGHGHKRHGHHRPFGAADMVRIMETAGLVNVSVEQVGRWVLGVGKKA